MRLHEDPRLFRQAAQFTADQMQIPAIYVEKDYWVTYALKTIFEKRYRCRYSLQRRDSTVKVLFHDKSFFRRH